MSGGDLLGVSSENSAWNLVSIDEDHTQRVLLRRRRRLANGWSLVFADLPNVDDVLDDFTHDAATSRFSVAVQLTSVEPKVTSSVDWMNSTATDVPSSPDHTPGGACRCFFFI